MRHTVFIVFIGLELTVQPIGRCVVNAPACWATRLIRQPRWVKVWKAQPCSHCPTESFSLQLFYIPHPLLFYQDMVLEALAAVGLAGNVVQLVHFSSSLLSKTREIHHSALGGPKEHFELEAVAKHLAGLIQRIQEQSPALSTFSELVGRCEQVSTELLSTLHELRRTNTPTSSKRWKSFRQAFKAVLGKDRIVELQTRLSTLRDEVMLHLVSAAR